MVRDQIEREGVTDPRVLAALRDVPRHLFVSPSFRAKAYEPYPLPIGEGQTISQPYVVCFMTQNLVFIEKDARGSITHRNVLPVAFVRLHGH
ncbi:MAG TPA: hypothetical protein VF357_10470 [Candidatus Deferrimicrobium sp.]